MLLDVAVRDGHTKDAKPPSDSRFERGRGQDVVENISDSRFGRGRERVCGGRSGGGCRHHS